MIAQAMLQRCAAVIAAATTATTLLSCDCNPTVFVTDRWFQFCGRNNWFTALHKYQQQQQTTHPFDNKRIWIIGASTGIGEELAYQLASPRAINHPIHLILSSRSVDKLEQVAATCRLSNPNCTVSVLGMDVTIDDELVTAVNVLKNRATAYEESIDCVVLNAGCGHLSPAIETTSETIDAVWRQTARWPMILIPLLFQNSLFRNTVQPHIVVTSSIAAIVPVPLSASYASAKSALLGYFRSLHAEQPNILLHTVMPGPIDTNFHKVSIHRHKTGFTGKMNSTSLSQNNDNSSNNANKQRKTSPIKMSVKRCVEIMITTMRLSYSTETWIASSPVLLGLYVQKFASASFMQSFVYSRIGPKRVDLWQKGLDLYDPISWRK